MGISLVSGLANTRDLLIDKATAAMDAAQGDLTDLLNPAEEQARYIAELIYSGELNIGNNKQLSDFLLAAVAGTRQIASLSFVSPDLNVTAGNRKTRRVINLNAKTDGIALSNFEQIASQQSGNWGPLVYVPALKETVLNFRQPVFKDGKFLGALIATIPVSAINEKLMASTSFMKGTRFVLYGKDSVLLQQDISNSATHLLKDGVVPKLSEIRDPILKKIWSPERTNLSLLGDQAGFHGHYLDVAGDGYLYFYSTLDGYTDKTLMIGYWIKDEDALHELHRLLVAGLAGLGIMLLSAVVALVIGRKISRPVLALSVASRKISRLDFSAVKALPRSRFKEVDEANDAYNTMLRGLSWFENYVPKSLVKKLMESGEALSEQRVVTVMFTDIVGFTPQAENMQSGEVAEFLNHHFKLVTSCIEAEGGTVDKFIGDAVMAFWGAPEQQEDHALRACRAALAIKQVIVADNAKRRANGLGDVHMRIGIHTGPLVVGNIGPAGRINYTVVGDTVNIAQRMEQYGKTLSPDQTDDVFTLITDATCEAAGPEIKAEKIGDHQVKGRHDPVKIYRLT